MRQFESSITLAATPKAIWQHMSDVVHWPQWMETFQYVEPLDSAELDLGRRFKVLQPRLRKADHGNRVFRHRLTLVRQISTVDPARPCSFQ